jgi:hypothetical protein
MISQQTRYPTFIGIGGMKCGTTWLSECLRYHPDIFMSAKKEIHFFGSQSNQDKGIEWYLEHFQGGNGYKAVGEISPSYLQRAKAAEHIKETVGHVKILAMFRDPIERFLSHYKQLIRNGELPKTAYSTLDTHTFSQAIDRAPRLIGHGNYYRNLVKFIDLFGAENICVVIKEDIDKDPQSELQKVYAFLGVDRDYLPPILNKKVSPGIIPRFPFLETLRIRLFHTFNKRAPQVIVYVRKLRLAEMYRKFNADTRPDQFTVKSEVIEQLRVRYRDEIERLEQFLGRELDTWRK